MTRFLIKHMNGEPKAAEALTFTGACRELGWDPADCTGELLIENSNNKWEPVDVSDIPNHFITHPRENTTPAKKKKETATQLAFETSVRVDLRHIHPNPYQPEGRVVPAEDIITRIAASIKQHGLLQTPVVRLRDGFYEMADGWIRLCGYARLYKESDAPEWRTLPVIIRELTDQQMADMVMEANTVRNDLSAIDLARFYKKYLEDFKVTQTELARLHNITQGEVANTLRLLELPADIQTKVISHDITETHARYLLQVKDPKKMTQLAKQVVERHTTVAELDREIKNHEWNSTLSLDAKGQSWQNPPVFDISACENCEHRVMAKYPYGNDPAQPRCDDKACWEKKQKQARMESKRTQIEAIKKKGVTEFPDGRPHYEKHNQLDGWAGKELQNPKECETCARRCSFPDFNDNYVIYCADKKCFDSKRNAKSKEDKYAQDAEEQKTAKYIDNVFANLAVNENTLHTAIECLLSMLEDYDDFIPPSFFKAFDLPSIGDDEDIDDFLSKVMPLIRQGIGDKDVLIRMLARLSFEIACTVIGRKEHREKMLKAFKNTTPAKAAPAAVPEFTTKKIDSDWVAVDSKGVIIAIAPDKVSAESVAVHYLTTPLPPILNPSTDQYELNHTYRISFKDHSFNDVTAQDINIAVAATGKKPEDVTDFKVYKSSGKKSTGGGVGCGWGKCTETIKTERDNSSDDDGEDED